ncbi:MAG: DapH/DapD/GlmU-related protein [Acidimicrobiia bacterium]
MSPRIHPTAIIEEDVEIGEGTAVWDSVHIRGPSSIGQDCIVGEKTYIAYGVSIADRVKINAQVYICTGVTVETGVMLSAGVTFTNDRFPRATTPDLAHLRQSEPDEETLETLVKEGATLGARSVIGPGLVIGRFAMVGMGAVVTRSLGDHHLAVGNPARATGVVCRCGQVVHRGDVETMSGRIECPRCGLAYVARDGVVTGTGDR